MACAEDQLAADFALDGLAYYYRGWNDNEYERIAAAMILGNSMLTARGIPCAGEADLKTCAAMFIQDHFGAGGSFCELYLLDFEGGFVVAGHDGPGHLGICDQKPILRGMKLFHGKAGHGVSVEFNVKNGPVTMLGVTQTGEGRLKFVAAQGESIPGPILQIGNTNTRVRFGDMAPGRVWPGLDRDRLDAPLCAGRRPPIGQDRKAGQAAGHRAGGGLPVGSGDESPGYSTAPINRALDESRSQTPIRGGAS